MNYPDGPIETDADVAVWTTCSVRECIRRELGEDSRHTTLVDGVYLFLLSVVTYPMDLGTGADS